MNEVDYLIKMPSYELKLQSNLEIKRLMPHQQTDFPFSHIDGRQKREVFITAGFITNFG